MSGVVEQSSMASGSWKMTVGSCSFLRVSTFSLVFSMVWKCWWRETQHISGRQKFICLHQGFKQFYWGVEGQMDAATQRLFAFHQHRVYRHIRAAKGLRAEMSPSRCSASQARQLPVTQHLPNECTLKHQHRDSTSQMLHCTWWAAHAQQEWRAGNEACVQVAEYATPHPS